MTLWVIRGAGRCAAARCYMLAESPAAAVAKLVSVHCIYFVVGSVEPVRVVMP